MTTKNSPRDPLAPAIPRVSPPRGTGRRTTVIAMTAETRHVPAVRHHVAAFLGAWGISPEDQNTTALIVSELAANAAVHGRADMTVMVSVYGANVSVQVIDSGGPPSPRSTLPPGDEHGRGLEIVRFSALSVHCLADATRTWVRADYRLGSQAA